MKVFSGLAIFVACLGLFGLTSYAIVKRTKEIGIRKVLGASAMHIVNLFTRGFVKLILVANVIAIPLMHVGANRWLENYAYRIELSGWFFAIPLILMIALALLTVTLQTIYVALKNPVESLKHE
jgi:putative ABC transport system permease protein